MTWFFTAYLLFNGVWVHGSTVDGHSPLAMPSFKYCMKAATRANTIEGKIDGKFVTMKFTCELERKDKW